MPQTDMIAMIPLGNVLVTASALSSSAQLGSIGPLSSADRVSHHASLARRQLEFESQLNPGCSHGHYLSRRLSNGTLPSNVILLVRWVRKCFMVVKAVGTILDIPAKISQRKLSA